jgi:chromosome segregation ATPase
MVVLAWKQGSRLAQGRAVGDLYLRIVGSARQGQIVRLSAPKCTIGSAEGCTLRLRAAGVRPLHCIILRGSRGTAIRCWARDTRLNGQPFGDSLLVPGDRLTVGPIEFDVLDAAGSAEPMSNQDSLNDRSTIVRRSSPSRQSAGRQAHIARQRARKLVAAVKQLRAEIAELQSRQSTAPANAHDTDAQDTCALESRRVELEQRIAEFEQERDKWEATHQGTQATLEARDRKLAAELAELAAAREGLRRELESAEELRARENRDQNEQAENRRRVEEELRLARDTFEQQRGAWAMENAQLHARLEQEQAELLRQREEAARILQEVEQQRDRRQSEFRSQLDELEHEQQDWNARRTTEESRLVAEQSGLERQREEILREKNELQPALEATRREREQIVADLARERQLWTAERTQAESHLAEQTSLIARQQAELAALHDELDEVRRQTEARQAEADRAAAEALVAAEELRERGIDFESRHAAAWRELDRLRLQVATLESIRSEPTDELHVRAAELEVARGELERLRSELETDRASIDDACRAVQQQAEVLEAERRALDQQREVSEQAQSQAALQADALAVSLANLADERAALADERHAWEIWQTEAEERLAGRTAELVAREQALTTQSASTETVVNVPPGEDRDWEARRAQFEQEREAWHTAREQGDAEYARQLEQFEAQLETLRTSEAELESQRTALAHERKEQEQCGESLRELASELEAKEKELFAKGSAGDVVASPNVEEATAPDARQAEIEQAREELDRQREELDRRREELEAEHNHASARIERQRAELEEFRNELEEARAELQSTQANSSQRSERAVSRVEEDDRDLSADEDSSPAAVAEDEVVDKATEQDVAEEQDAVEVQGIAEDDEELDEDEAPLAVGPTRSQRAATTASNSDEESIDDYMAALLDRMRGGKPPEVVVAPQPKRNKRKSDPMPAEERSAEDAAVRDVTSGHVVDMPMGAAELARRTPPVEKTDLTAMRELANTQASIAITRFGKKRLLKKAIRDWSLGLLCVAATLFLLMFTPETATVARTGSMLGIAAGIYWLFTGLLATKQWIAIGQRHKRGRTPKTAENKKS